MADVDVDVDAVVDEVQTWLAEHWDPERPLVRWRSLLADSGWGCPSWPTEWYGRGLHPSLNGAIAACFARAGAVGTAAGTAMTLVAPTVLAHGSDELKARLLRPMITGEHKWCQLFSEPGNGSDLAGLTTGAVRDGDEWVVNGQKVWNTGAHHAQWGMLLARTDFDVPKHRGISFFCLPMEQPGVEVRPLRQMNFHSSFNEVFLGDARVAHSNLVGEVGGGWAVAMTTLMHERGLAGNRVPDFSRADAGRTVREAKAEAEEYFRTYVWYPQRAGRPDLVQPHARRVGRNTDPVLRQRMASVHAFAEASRWTALRAQAARAAGRPPGPEGSLGKLSSSITARACNAVHTQLAGAHGMLAGTDPAADPVIAEVLISTPGQSIAGGTDEIQHNIMGERVLGLPKEPSLDNDIPFREVRRN
ncbi:MAG: acyl-CoA dehydrogenase family protein [Acidimicrobiales bacterium]